MRFIAVTGVMFLASAISGQAMADCAVGGAWTQVMNLVSTLTNGSAPLGMTACSLAGEGTQEEHHLNGQLWDYKCGNSGSPSTGPGTPCFKPNIDLRRQLGTWSVANDATVDAAVTYDYTAFGGGYIAGPFKVYTDGTDYDFCDGTTSVGTFTLVATTGTSRVCP